MPICWRGRAPPSYRREASPHLGHRSAPLQTHSRRRCRPLRRTNSESSRIRSTRASSPGTISAVPTATPPFAIAGFASVSPTVPSSRTFSANTSLSPRRSRQRSMNSPRSIRSPIAARPSTTISQSRSDAFSAISISIWRRTRARSNKMVSCGSQARCEPAASLSTIFELRGRTLRPIDLLRGRRSRRKARPLAGRNLDVETIAAGDTAGSIDENRRQTRRLGRGKANTQRAGFMQMTAAGEAFDLMYVEGHRTLGTVGRENRGSLACGIDPHSSPGRNYSAICRLISLASRLLRSQAYFTAPLSMTAKLSPSSQAKSRYCSTRTIAMLPRLRR